MNVPDEILRATERRSTLKAFAFGWIESGVERAIEALEQGDTHEALRELNIALEAEDRAEAYVDEIYDDTDQEV